MSGINTRKCCCCSCGMPIGKSIRATVSGWTPACCANGQKPDALYGSWTLSAIAAFGTPPCTFGVDNGGNWSWRDSCGSGSATTRQVSIRLRLAPPSQTGTGAYEWQVEFGYGDSLNTVIKGSLPYSPSDPCASLLTFANNGYHILGTLNTGCSSDGTVTIDFP